MNKSIETVSLTSNSDRVRELTRQLYANAGKRVRVTFTKKDGSVRVMDCLPKPQYNDTLGISTTQVGRRMVASKAKKGMITVCEVVDNPSGGVTMQPRTINLNRVIGNIVPLMA